MTPQHSKKTRNFGGLAFGFRWRGFDIVKQKGTEVTVAETIQREFATDHGSKQEAVVGAERLKCSYSTPLNLGWFTDGLNRCTQWLVMFDARHGFQIPFVRLLADLGAAVEVGDVLMVIE